MDTNKLKALLDEVAAGRLKPEAAVARLRSLPFEDLGFAKIDHHRTLRKGYPEVIFCAGKTADQVVAIVDRMVQHGSNVLGTRCTDAVLDAVGHAFPQAAVHGVARAFHFETESVPTLGGYIAVLCAGTSDIPVAEEAALTCEVFGNKVERVCDVGVAGIHRLFDQRELLEKANVLVVCAGMEGALPSVVAGLVDVPVIAVPTSVGYGASFGGVTALLSMLNSCATGVAVVNIDNGFGAGALAATINRIANGKHNAGG